MAMAAKLTPMEKAALELLRLSPGLVISIAHRRKLRVFQRLRTLGLAVCRSGAWGLTDAAPASCTLVPVLSSWHPLPGSRRTSRHDADQPRPRRPSLIQRPNNTSE